MLPSVNGILLLVIQTAFRLSVVTYVTTSQDETQVTSYELSQLTLSFMLPYTSSKAYVAHCTDRHDPGNAS